MRSLMQQIVKNLRQKTILPNKVPSKERGKGVLTYLERGRDKKERITLVKINLSKLVIELQKYFPKK